ncbi:MAG: RDD family protein [Bacteroidota bacterium]
MERLCIDTCQNVDIEHNIASIGERMLAHLIDYSIFFGYFLSMWMFGSALKLFDSLAYIIIILVPLFIYDLVFEYFYNGQSLGKKIIRIKVVRLDGSPATFSNHLIRWIFRVIDNLLIWGAVSSFTIIFNGRGQRLGDIAAGTTVIRIGHRLTLQETIYVIVPPNYNPVYIQAKHLDEKDIRTLQEVINYYRRNTYTLKNAHFAIRTKNAVEKKLNIKSEKPPLFFFQTILMDYNFFNRA